MSKNANEARKIHAMTIASLLDHLGDQVAAFEEATTEESGPKNWAGVGDLDHVANVLARLVSTMSNGLMTPEEARQVAEENVAEVVK